MLSDKKLLELVILTFCRIFPISFVSLYVYFYFIQRVV